MALSLLVCGILLASVFISVEAQGHAKLLECRVCHSAVSLEDCKETAVCSRNEECYTDEIITTQLTIIYNSGCRSKAVCDSTTHHTGKRAGEPGGGLLACTHCCNTSKPENATGNQTECNANMCGLKLKNNYANQCYYCGEDDASQGSVDKARSCRKIKLCSDDEVCRVTTQSTAGTITHSFSCNQRLQCQMLTIVTLQNEGVTTNVDLATLASSGDISFVGRKRQTDVCDICCGDGLCNDDECDVVKTRLVAFAKGGGFNYTTLKTSSGP